MVTIDTSSLTTWENADRIDSMGLNFVSHTESVRTRVDEMNGDWKAIDPHYSGVGNQELVDGLMPAVRQANQLANAGVAADAALLTFADRLRTLTTDRSTFESDVAAFEAAHGGEALEELEPGPRAEYSRLDGKAGTLQGDYESAVQTCVGSLNRIRPESLPSTSPEELGASDYAMMGVDSLMFGALPGAFADTRVVRTSRQGSHAARPSISHHATLFGRHVRFLDPVMAVAGNPRGAWAAFVQSSTATGRRSGPVAFGPTRHVSEAIERHTLPRPNVSGMTLAQRARYYGGSFGSSFLDGLPVVGEARGARTASATTTHRGFAVDTGRVSGALRTGGRAFGTVGTVFTAGLTFREERESETAQVAAENPELNRQQVEQRATENAAMGTAGRVGSTILASAAVGAAAGTVVPGPGNVVGFVAGLATGIAMELPIADVDGDGQKDSLSKMAGEGLKNAWDWVRGR